MSTLIVYTYDSQEKAGTVLASVAAMKQENVQRPLLAIEDAAVVVKKPNGKIKVQQTLESAVKGSNVVSGGFWGLLVGFLFGGPLLGTFLGMGLTALFGRNIDLGIDNKFIDGIGEDLTPGDSALFLLVGDTPVETVTEALSQHGGTLYHTSLPKEAAEALAQAVEHEPIAEALSEEAA